MVLIYLTRSTDCDTMLKHCFEEAFRNFVKSAESMYFPLDSITTLQESGSIEIEPKSKGIPLAALLPFITRSAHQVINGIPNSYVEVRHYTPNYTI